MSDSDESQENQSLSSDTHITDNTTAADHLEDIDISSYILADAISGLEESVSALTTRFEYYQKLLRVCEEIARANEDPTTYFEAVYSQLPR